MSLSFVEDRRAGGKKCVYIREEVVNVIPS
jgi:hypothetical protein